MPRNPARPHPGAPVVASLVFLLPLLLAACGPAPIDSEPDGGAAAAASGSATPSQVAYLATDEQAELDLPFSEAVRVGDMLYLSGQVGNLPGTLEVVEGGITAEARQTMENIQAVLERWGSSLDRVVKCTVMIDEIEEWGAFNEVYVEFFPEEKPARSAFGADGLALGAAVEVECWATVG